ncbi:hypothetical protein U9M48_043481 [Paspalum notatum var. saurae]|uniref:Uncharacterized protein n=1 Tax=Paspalum notatum var. saurae TaxID=547442 RepID=A0AAQ3UWZ8_PASNO
MDKLNHGIEEQTQEQPLIEEPEDQEPDPQSEEYPQAAPDFASEEANPSEEGRQDHILPANIVWSSSSVPVLAEGLVIIRSKKRVDLANEVTSVGMMLLYFCKSFGCHEL